MVTFELRNRTDEFMDFDYYVEGRKDDHGVFRYFPDEPKWEAIEPAPGDFGNRYSNHIGCSFAREGVRERGTIAWW